MERIITWSSVKILAHLLWFPWECNSMSVGRIYTSGTKPAIMFLLVIESSQAELNNWENTQRVITMPAFSDRYVWQTRLQATLRPENSLLPRL